MFERYHQRTLLFGEFPHEELLACGTLGALPSNIKKDGAVVFDAKLILVIEALLPVRGFRGHIVGKMIYNRVLIEVRVSVAELVLDLVLTG